MRPVIALDVGFLLLNNHKQNNYTTLQKGLNEIIKNPQVR